MTADEIRSILVNHFKANKPILDGYYEYAKRASSLALEYHDTRLRETFPNAVRVEAVLLRQCDGRETPTSLDKFLAALTESGREVTHILFDPTAHAYYLFLKTDKSVSGGTHEGPAAV